MSFLTWLRLAVFCTSVVFSIIVLGLAADLTSLSLEFFGSYFIFAALAIATACLTIITVPILLIVDWTRRGAFTSMIVVELSWLGVLWILWLATGADVTNANDLSFGTCDFINSDINLACHEFSAIEAFSYLNWILLMGYSAVLLISSIIVSARGHKVWTVSVREAPFFAPRSSAAPEGKYGGADPAYHAPVTTQQQNASPAQGNSSTSGALIGSYPPPPAAVQSLPPGSQSAYPQV